MYVNVYVTNMIKEYLGKHPQDFDTHLFVL